MRELSIHSIMKILKICVDSLIWISNNSVNDSIRIRAKDTIKEVSKIITERNPKEP